MRRHPNVAVLHTFSKAYGLAGLRIGYAVAPEEVATNLRKVAVPFGVSALAQRAAIASLDAETELERRVQLLVDERTRLLAGLREQGWTVPESQANFVWLRTGPGTEAAAEAFAAAGVLVRAFPGEGMRISIGTPEAVDAVLRVAAELRAGR